MLSEKRAQFVQRQAQLQARNASDAAARAKAAGPPPARSSGSGSGSAVKSGPPTSSTSGLDRSNWRNDKDKYAQILEVRRMPVGAQMMKVILLLKKERRSLSPEEIETETFVDISLSAELQRNLRSNPKVAFEGGRYIYKATYSLAGKEELLHLIRTHKDGIPSTEVEDSYPTVSNDIEELRSAGQVWKLQNSDSKVDILYPNDPRIQITVDDDIRQLVHSVKLSDWHDMERELKRAGMVPATSAARRESMLADTSRQGKEGREGVKGGGKKRRESKRTKYTNSHLPELLRGIEMPPGM